jgi:hypothetical protein
MSTPRFRLTTVAVAVAVAVADVAVPVAVAAGVVGSPRSGSTAAARPSSTTTRRRAGWLVLGTAVSLAAGLVFLTRARRPHVATDRRVPR